MIQLRIDRYRDKDKDHLLRALKFAKQYLEELDRFSESIGDHVSNRVMNDFENVIKYLESIVEE